MEMKFGIFIIIALALSLIISFTSLYISTQGEWVCIAKKCSSFATGDDWVARFCRPNENKTDMDCTISMNGEDYQIPLSNLDVNTVRECIEDECAVSVYVKQTKIGG